MSNSNTKPRLIFSKGSLYSLNNSDCFQLAPNALGFPDRKAIAKNLAETVVFCKTLLGF